jgi:hypothetical protein
MIRKGTRVVVLDADRVGIYKKDPPPGVVLGQVHWDRTYYKVRLDDGRVITSEKVRRP